MESDGDDYWGKSYAFPASNDQYLKEVFANLSTYLIGKTMWKICKLPACAYEVNAEKTCKKENCDAYLFVKDWNLIIASLLMKIMLMCD